MSDLSINTTLRGPNSTPSRTVSSSGGGAPVSTPAPNPVPVPSKFINSPKGTIDSSSGMFVVQFRDGDGKVTMQYPAPKASNAYKQSAAVNVATSTPQGVQADTSSRPAAKAPESAPAAPATPAKPGSV